MYTKVDNYYLLIPIELCAHIIRNKQSRDFQIWLVLKSICSGAISIDINTKRYISEEIGVSVRTVERSIKKLLNSNWIGFNPKSETYFIRGIDTVCKIERISNKASCWFERKWIKNVKEFCISALHTELIVKQKRKSYHRKGLVNSDSGSVKEENTSRRKNYFPIAILAVSKIFDIKFDYVAKLRRMASGKIIETIEDFEPLILGGQHRKASELALISQAFNPGMLKRVRTIKGKLFIQKPSLVKSTLTRKRRKYMN